MGGGRYLYRAVGLYFLKLGSKKKVRLDPKIGPKIGLGRTRPTIWNDLVVCLSYSSLNLCGPYGPSIPTVLSYNAFKLPFSNCMYFTKCCLEYLTILKKSFAKTTEHSIGTIFGALFQVCMHCTWIIMYDSLWREQHDLKI